MLLDPHLGTILWTIITFVVVLLILKKFAWPQLLASLDEREHRISDAINSAEQARTDRATAAYAAGEDVIFDDWPAAVQAFATGYGLTGCAGAIPPLVVVISTFGAEFG